ncbi:restriction endonuclease subunit S [Myroides odoratus]
MEFKTIKDLCIVTKGSTGISKAVEGEYPLVVTSDERKSHNEFQFNTKAVIVPLVSSTGHGHASLKRIHYQAGKFAVGSILCAIIPKDESVLSAEFLYHYLNLNKERELVSRMKGMANVTLPIKEIEKITVPILTMEEQLSFIKYYSKIEDYSITISSEVTFQLDLIKDLRQAFLREAMQGTLVSNETTDGKTGADLLAEIQTEKTKLIKEKKIKKGKPLVPIAEEEIPFDIPENWTWCRLESINSKIGSGSTPKGGNYSQEGYPFFRSQNIQNDCLVFDDIKYINDDVQLRMKGTKVISNDLLLNITGGSLGRCALVPKEFKEGNVSQHVCILRSVLVLPKFYHQLIISPFIQQLIFSSTTGAGREGLPKYNLEQFVIPLPPLEVQERIVTKLDELMSYCDKLETQVKESQKTNELLLQQVLREALEGKPQEESREKEVRDYQTIVDSVFGTSNKVQSINNSDLEDAALVYLMKNNLGYSYGEVALQKAKYNSSYITPNLYSKQYDFRNYHFGTYSEELRGDLQNNPYLIQKKENGKEVFAINPSKEKEILDIISNKENKDFVIAINELLQIYSLPFIGKKTDMMELFNTVLKIYADLRITNIDIIYQAMKDWKVKQTGFKTKAEKFSKEDTEKMIKLLQSKNIIK